MYNCTKRPNTEHENLLTYDLKRLTNLFALNDDDNDDDAKWKCHLRVTVF